MHLGSLPRLRYARRRAQGLPPRCQGKSDRLDQPVSRCMLEEGPRLAAHVSLFFTKRRRTECVRVSFEDGGARATREPPPSPSQLLDFN